MSLTIQHMPTLGYFNKIICDCLGLWSSEKKDIIFNVPATEKERRKALSEAFNAIRRDDGSCGSLDELILITIETSPKQKEITRKNRTIQDHTNYLSKEDFSSYNEFVEFKEYINITLADKYEYKPIASIASEVYSLSILYYREFIREHAIKPGTQIDSYLFFIKNILVNMIVELVDSLSIKSVLINKDKITNDKNKWPLRSFVDTTTDLCGVSLHKLHQFHEVRLNDSISSDEEIWNSDLKSQLVNTKSKQIIDRLNKRNKIKWDTFYHEIKPLIPLLPEEIDEAYFTIKAYSAFLIHNINIHAHEMGSLTKSSTPILQENYPTGHPDETSFLPITDRIDLLFNDIKPASKSVIQRSVDDYHDLVKRLRLLDSSLINESDFPNTLQIVYSENNIDYSVETLQKNIDEVPLWVNEWALAKKAMSLGNMDSTLDHFKKSLEASKYVAGSLFIVLYIEICAFCKYQYKELKKRNEEHLFDRFYECLGKDASKYAILLGYCPSSSRDPETLMPKVITRKKNGLLITKIDSMASGYSINGNS